MAVLTDLRGRGIHDVVFAVCDGLKGLPEVVSNMWPLTTVRTCRIHLIRTIICSTNAIWVLYLGSLGGALLPQPELEGAGADSERY